MQETQLQFQAAQFRVALLLKRYKFGAASAAKYLGKSRGLIQSWMQIGNNHYLAKEKIKLKSFEKIVKNLRYIITKENINYFLVMRLIDLDLPVAFISKVIGLPTSTVRSWRYGKVPCEIKKFFYDRKLVEREFNKMLKHLRTDITRNNLDYYLALRLSETARKNIGHRRIGGRIISKILTKHFNQIEGVPEKTVSCWIDGNRKPWGAFPVLSDEQLIRREYNRITDELTYEHLTYHISMALFNHHGWKYSKISNELEINKELVRGWVKKGRGNPVAKIFVNKHIVESELEKYLDASELKNNEELKPQKKGNITYNSVQPKKASKDEIINESKKDDFDRDLEQELIYHLETFPTGVTSPKVLKSILIEHPDVPVVEIEKVLQNSKSIVRNRITGKWILKRFDKMVKEVGIDEDLEKIKCKHDSNDEVICSD
jgi:hypothetical protein